MKKETSNSEYVKITKEDFDYLIKRSWFLNRLDEGGVDTTGSAMNLAMKT